MFRRFVLACSAVLLVTLAASRPASSQMQAPADLEALQRQVQSLAIGQAAIQQQLQEIRDVLRVLESPQARRAPAPIASIDVVVDTAGAPAKGAAAARLTIIEFSDFECPFCGRYVRDVLGLIEREYIQTGSVRYVFRSFPLEAMHPHAFKASVASLCAAEQSRYWDMHDRLFAHQAALDAGALIAYGRDLKLSPATYESCLATESPAARIRQDQADGRQAGVDSTPSFLIGYTVPGDSKVRAIRFIRGAQPYAVFKTELDKLLAQG